LSKVGLDKVVKALKVIDIALVGAIIVLLLVLIHPWEGPMARDAGVVIGYNHDYFPLHRTQIIFAKGSLLVEGTHFFEVGHVYEITYTRHAYHLQNTIIEVKDKGLALDLEG